MTLCIDLHIHSKYSYDSVLEPRDIVKTAAKKGLSIVAVTDHDSIRGGIETKKLSSHYGVEVIVGCEFSTSRGDLIGLFLDEMFRANSPQEIVEEIRERGGVSVLPHPYRLGPPDVELARMVDVIEAYNGRTSLKKNHEALSLSVDLAKPAMAGSDAHFRQEIGVTRTRLHSDTASLELKKELFKDTELLFGNHMRRYLTLSKYVKAVRSGSLKDVIDLTCSEFLKGMERELMSR